MCANPKLPIYPSPPPLSDGNIYYSLIVNPLCIIAIHSKNYGLRIILFYYFKKCIYFNWRLITLQYCSGFCHTLTWVINGCTCVPHPEPPSHLPPYPIPLGCPRAPTFSALFHELNLDWWSISHMVIYMFQCYSLKSPHLRLLPQSPKVCFYSCVSFVVSDIGLSLPSF